MTRIAGIVADVLRKRTAEAERRLRITERIEEKQRLAPTLEAAYFRGRSHGIDDVRRDLITKGIFK